MRLMRLMYDGDARYGIAENGTVTLISDEPFAAFEPEGVVPFDQVEPLVPVIPTKIVCVGVNYRGHAKEMGHELPEDPVIFLKPATGVNRHGGDIRIPQMASRVDYEAELAVVLGRRAHQISPDEARRAILGFTCANDVTARDLQKKDGQWTRAKGFDGFCPLGPWVETEFDPSDASIECRVNGEVRQQASTAEMIRDPFELVSFVSHVMTLLPGDVVLTGTPAGIGPMSAGDIVEVDIEGIGTLLNRVTD